MIGGFPSVLRVLVFQGSLLVIVIMIDSSKKRNREGGFLNFRVRVFLTSEVISWVTNHANNRRFLSFSSYLHLHA